jgi:hypothetical protein
MLGSLFPSVAQITGQSPIAESGMPLSINLLVFSILNTVRLYNVPNIDDPNQNPYRIISVGKCFALFTLTVRHSYHSLSHTSQSVVTYLSQFSLAFASTVTNLVVQSSLLRGGLTTKESWPILGSLSLCWVMCTFLSVLPKSQRR